MPLDPYALCPCGSGKKLKFCCHDLAAELEKLQKMAAADQSSACLAHVEKLEQKHPDRACLLSTKSLMQLRLEKLDDATKTIERFVEKFPQNPLAHSLASLIKAKNHELKQAIDHLQSAWECMTEGVPDILFDTMVVLGEGLYLDGHPMSARAHLRLAASADPESEAVAYLSTQLERGGGIPLLMKEDLVWTEPPDGAEWGEPYDKAVEQIREGCWRRAVGQLQALSEKYPDAAAIWRTLGICHGWLTNEEPAAVALRKAAEVTRCAEEGVECEALAQLLLKEQTHDKLDLMQWRYPVTDSDHLQALLASQRQAFALPTAGQQWDDDIPPLASFEWLDRPRPQSEEPLSVESAPRMMIEVNLFGKRTDRDAYLEFTGTRTPANIAARDQVLELAKDAIDAGAVEEEVAHQIPAEEELLTVRLWTAPGTPPDRTRDLMREARRSVILNQWPDLESQRFGGKSARAAASEMPQKVGAAVLMLELRDGAQWSGGDLNELRRTLGLEELKTVDPAGTSTSRFPLVRLHRFEFEKLEDEDLMIVYLRAVQSWAREALVRVIRELVKRPSMDKEVDKPSLYRMQLDLAGSTDEALEIITAGRETTPTDHDAAQAGWDLNELSLRLVRGEAERFQQLVQRLSTRYNHLPEVRNALIRMLMEFGLIGPDGRPAQMAPEVAAAFPGAAGPAGTPAGAPPAAAPEAGKLWTPGAEPSKPAGESKLWVPGSD